MFAPKLDLVLYISRGTEENSAHANLSQQCDISMKDLKFIFRTITLLINGITLNRVDS